MDDTFPKLLLRNASKYGDRKVAFREKKLGIWQEVTWQRYYDDVRDVSLGLVELGLKRGDSVIMLGSNRREWFELALATQAAGGIAVALYQDATAREVAKAIDVTGATIIVAEDQEQVDKILQIKDRIKGLRSIIYYETRGMEYYSDEHLLAMDALREAGSRARQNQADLFEVNVSQGSGDEPAVVVYTSGLTRTPRGAVLSYRNILSQVESWRSFEDIRETDEYVSFVSPGYVGEIVMTLGMHQVAGFVVNFPESEDTVPADLREIGPHIVVAPARFWELIVGTFRLKGEETSNFKRGIYRRYMSAATRDAEDRLRKGTKPVKPGGIGNFMVFRPIRDSAGLLRTRLAFNMGGSISPEVITSLHAIGVPIRQIYGLTECAGIAVMHRPDDIRLETAGQPMPGMEIRTLDTGEIVLQGPSVFNGYQSDDAATAEVLRDGWLHTGDVGEVTPDNHLVVIDRLSGVIELPDGSRASAQAIANRLTTSAYIDEALVIGQGRPFVSALIAIDQATVGKWAEAHQLNYRNYGELSQLPEVYDLIRGEVEHVNEALPDALKIRRYALIHRELSADEGELTRTMKVRRSVVEQRFAPVIDALYSQKDTVTVPTEVHYADGRVVQTETDVRVASLAPELAEARK